MIGLFNESKAFDDKTGKTFMGLYEVKQGILAHDRGWFGTNREGIGPDYNFELMFNSPDILKKIGSPKPILGFVRVYSRFRIRKPRFYIDWFIRNLFLKFSSLSLYGWVVHVT